MKEACTINSKPKSEQGRSRIRSFISTHTKKIRQGPLTCPICKEIFYGLSKLGRHIKDHCT